MSAAEPTMEQERGIGTRCLMIFFRIAHRFRGRASEWYCAAQMACWGAGLLHSSPTFSSPAYAAFEWMGESVAGWLVGSIGALWLVGLIVNGSRERATSAIRTVCAVLGSLTYGFLAIGFFNSFLLTGVWNLGTMNYALTSMLAAYALFWIRRDLKAGEHCKARRG